MSKLWTVTVYGAPAAKGSMKCVGRGGHHTLVPANRERLAPWMKILGVAALRLAQAAGGPLDGPVGVQAAFVLDRPKSVSREKRPWPTARDLDVDKGLRAVLDAFQPHVFADDSQVVDSAAAKYYPDSPGAPGLDRAGAVITVWRITDGQTLC